MRYTVARFGIIAGYFIVWSLVSAIAQAPPELSGTVTTANGQPIAGVRVYGSESKECCPKKFESTTTDATGHFTLKAPGAVVHFNAEGFQPRLLIVQKESANLRIELEPNSTSNVFLLPPCRGVARGMRRIEGGSWRISFDVPKKDFEILGGRPDTDYVRWVIKKKSSQSYINLWFGPYAFGPEPNDDLLLDSVSMTERNVRNSDGQGFGIDAFGELPNGDKWRHLSLAIGDGADYRAPATDTSELDKVLNSACQKRAH